MCIWYVYIWECCEREWIWAPESMQQPCQKNLTNTEAQVCTVELKLLDGDRYNVHCPRCGDSTLTPNEEEIFLKDIIGC